MVYVLVQTGDLLMSLKLASAKRQRVSENADPDATDDDSDVLE